MVAYPPDEPDTLMAWDGFSALAMARWMASISFHAIASVPLNSAFVAGVLALMVNWISALSATGT